MNENVNLLAQYLVDNNTQMLKMNIILFYLHQRSVNSKCFILQVTRDNQ